MDNQLKGKQKLVFEACQKIEQGQRLILEGQIELRNLVPDGTVYGSEAVTAVTKKIVAPKTVKAINRSLVRRKYISDEVLIEKIMEMIDKEGDVTSFKIHNRFHIHESRIKRLLSELSGRVVLIQKKTGEGAGRGSSKYWTRVALK